MSCIDDSIHFQTVMRTYHASIMTSLSHVTPRATTPPLSAAERRNVPFAVHSSPSVVALVRRVTAPRHTDTVVVFPT